MVNFVYTPIRTEDSLNFSVCGTCDSGILISLPASFVPGNGIFFTFTAAVGSAFRFVEELREKIAGLLISVISGSEIVPRILRRAVLPMRKFGRTAKPVLTGTAVKCRILRL